MSNRKSTCSALVIAFIVEMPSLFPTEPAFERFRQNHPTSTNPPASVRLQQDTPASEVESGFQTGGQSCAKTVVPEMTPQVIANRRSLELVTVGTCP